MIQESVGQLPPAIYQRLESYQSRYGQGAHGQPSANQSTHSRGYTHRTGRIWGRGDVVPLIAWHEDGGDFVAGLTECGSWVNVCRPVSCGVV